MKAMFLVNFDTHRMAWKENNMDWEVGETTIFKGQKMMVYANFNLSTYGVKVFHWFFQKGLKRFENFCDTINYNVEELIKLTSNDDLGKRLEKMEIKASLDYMDALISYHESLCNN